ncbi:MAG: hypothetical protein PQJ61_02130 [Spirochaetales bacterium]|uniref:Uncharacterized protein n=1 Tax=Candidatus Thalassospirochaeta sargassi TaxID=3119039 RepID=A0AAJ1MML6_9SPIO|nr:hypothetical protein [Spirochaetales bacterium]
MTDETAKYIRCRNCGKHVEKNQSIAEIFCSEECAETFTRCPNCGKFFPAVNKERFEGFCSNECKTVYDDDGIISSNNSLTEDEEASASSQVESQAIKEE